MAKVPHSILQYISEIGNLEGEEVAAIVTGRGKVTGSYYNYFNIRDQRGLDWNVNLETAGWSRAEEDVMMVLILRSRHGESDCKSAKQTELKKLQDFGAFSLAKDEGQFKIIARSAHIILVSRE